MDISIFFNSLANCFVGDQEQELSGLWLQNSLRQICSHKEAMLVGRILQCLLGGTAGPFLSCPFEFMVCPF